jgi:triacylglycerol lipase
MLRLGLLLTALSTTGCWHLLPPGDFTTPEYWADFFLDQYTDQLVVGELEPGPEPLSEPRTVLLITGVTIPARWFEPIAARLRRDGFDPVVWEPPALLSYDLFEASEDLAQVVERVHAGSGQARIDILAECTGGLIARHYIQSMGGEAKVDRMVTFVSPQHGVDKAPWAYEIAGWPALRDLTPGSDFLQVVNEAPLPQTTDITSIFSCSDEYIQPYETSIIPGAINIGLCDGTVDHFEMFFDPDVYRVMHGALIRPLDHPPAEVPEMIEEEPEEVEEGPGVEEVPEAPALEEVPEEAAPESPDIIVLMPAEGEGEESPAHGGIRARVVAQADEGCTTSPSGPASSLPLLGLLGLVWRRRR